MQMLIASRRADASIRHGRAHCASGALLENFVKSLPFELTHAQRKVIAEIRRDLAANYPMNRLLQGDVGSGKTAVAIAAMLLAIEAGYQAAFMAPTQILAEQHYDVLRGGSNRWVCASLCEQPQGRKKAVRCRCLQRDEPQIIVGTHALLYESVSFSNLGLAIIDEQHKFGVAQRERLTARKPAPHVLVMTATPIPRTLTMTLYGDLDVSTIDEMPRNRGRIITAVRDSSKLARCSGSCERNWRRARQAYVIYPLIDESEKPDAKAAAAEYDLWRERLHPFRCELLHGRMRRRRNSRSWSAFDAAKRMR